MTSKPRFGTRVAILYTIVFAAALYCIHASQRDLFLGRAGMTALYFVAVPFMAAALLSFLLWTVRWFEAFVIIIGCLNFVVTMRLAGPTVLDDTLGPPEDRLLSLVLLILVGVQILAAWSIARWFWAVLGSDPIWEQAAEWLGNDALSHRSASPSSTYELLEAPYGENLSEAIEMTHARNTTPSGAYRVTVRLGSFDTKHAANDECPVTSVAE